MKHTQTKFIIMFLAGALFSTFTVFAAQISVNTQFDNAVNYLQKIVLSDAGDHTGVVLDGNGGSYFLGNLGVGTNSPIGSALVVSGEVNFSNGTTTIEGQLEVDDKVTFGSGLEVDNNVNLHSSLIVDDQIQSNTICKADGTDCKNVADILTTADSYTHPATHPASMIIEDSSKNFVSTTEKSTWDGKQNRIAAACSAGSSISAIAENGTVTCEVDTDTNTQLTEAQVDAMADDNGYLETETDPQVGTIGTNGKWCTSNGSQVTCNSTAPIDTNTQLSESQVDSYVSNNGYLTSYSESDPQVGTLTSSKWCTTNGTNINCTSDAPSGADTQDLSYNAATDVISLTDGGSIDITEVDTNTQLSESQVDSYVSNNGYLTSYSESDPQVGMVANGKWCTANGVKIDCTSDAPTATSVWNTSANGINYTDKNVSIGTTAYASKLNISSTNAMSMLDVNINNTNVFNIGSNGAVTIDEYSPISPINTPTLLTVNGNIEAIGLTTTEDIEAGDLIIPDLKRLDSTNCTTEGAIIYSTRDNELCFCDDGGHYKLISNPAQACQDGTSSL